MKALPLTDGYMAGFIDGRGYIYIARHRTGLYYCWLMFHMDPGGASLLRDISRQFGGSKVHVKRDGSAQITISSGECIALLRRVRDMLRVKGEQIDLCLRFYAMYEALPGKKKKRWTPEAKRAAAELREEINSLNKLYC